MSTYAVNVLGTAHVLEAVRRLAPEAAVVVVTSDKCYANDGSGRAFREDDPLGGHDPYSSSKAAQELVASAYRESFGLRLATARAGNVIGGGDWAADRLVPDLVRAAAAGTAAVVRNPGHVRPWQHVLNPLAGYLRLAERLLAGDAVAEAWNLGPRRTTSARCPRALPRKLAGRLRAGSGGRRRRGGRGAGPPARLARARSRLGWGPAWNLETGSAATAEWYTRQLAGAYARGLVLDQIERYQEGPPT